MEGFPGSQGRILIQFTKREHHPLLNLEAESNRRERERHPDRRIAFRERKVKWGCLKFGSCVCCVWWVKGKDDGCGTAYIRCDE